MKFKSIIFILLVTLITLVTPFTAHAHVLKTDKDIGAVFHVTPDDDPIARQESEFFFEIKDKTNKFRPENCNCQVSIQQGDQLLSNQTLFHSQHSNNLSSSSFTFTFPKKAIYKVIISGSPIDQSSFQPFTLTYDIRVDREIANTNPQATQTEEPATPLAYILLPIILVIFLVITLFGKKKDGSPKNLIIVILGLVLSTTLLNIRPLLFLEPTHHEQVAIHHEQSHPCCIPQFIATDFKVNLAPPISYNNTHDKEPQKIHHSAIKSLIKNKSPPSLS